MVSLTTTPLNRSVSQTCISSATPVHDSLNCAQHIVFVLVCVQLKLDFGDVGKLDHPDTNLVFSDVPLVEEILDKGQQEAEVLSANAG